jgi:small subunit ribosomal protein S8
MTDPIADALTPPTVRVERQAWNFLSKVKRAGRGAQARLHWDFTEVEVVKFPQLRVELKYGPNGERVIRHIRLISKPGRRIYNRATELRPILNGLGISIISTSRGVISDREARQRNLGGEVLCEVW